MATANKRVVTVWLDETSDEHGWVVDTDAEAGGESETLRVFPADDAGYAAAVAFAGEAAAERGCEVLVK